MRKQKKTRHAESRTAKKTAERKTAFFREKMPVYAHPLGDDRLEKLLDLLLRTKPDRLIRKLDRDWQLLDIAPARLGYEEFMVLNSIQSWFHSWFHPLTFALELDQSTIHRTIEWKWFTDRLEEWAAYIWMDPASMEIECNRIRISVWRKYQFDFPEFRIPFRTIISKANAYWQSKIESENSNPKEKAEFVKFLATLVRGMVFAPKNIPVEEYRQELAEYEYTFDDRAFARIRKNFPRLMIGSENSKADLPQTLPAVHWTLSAVALNRALSDDQSRKCKKVVLVTGTRPAEGFRKMLKNHCETSGLVFISGWFPKDVVNLDFSTDSICLIENATMERLSKYVRLSRARVIALSGIRESHQQRRHG